MLERIVQSLTSSEEFLEAAKNNNLEKLKAALNHNPLILSATDPKSGGTALHFACKSTHPRIVKWLLENGLNSNDVDKINNTPLHLAAVMGHEEIVTLLLDQDADLAFKNKEGETAEDVASTDEIRQLIKARSGLRQFHQTQLGMTIAGANQDIHSRADGDRKFAEPGQLPERFFGVNKKYTKKDIQDYHYPQYDSRGDITKLVDLSEHYNTAIFLEDRHVKALAYAEYAVLTRQAQYWQSEDFIIKTLDEFKITSSEGETGFELRALSIQEINEGVDSALTGKPTFFAISNIQHWVIIALLPAGDNGEIDVYYMNSAFGFGAKIYGACKLVGLEYSFDIVNKINSKPLKNASPRVNILAHHIYLENTQQLDNNCGVVAGFNIAAIAAYYKSYQQETSSEKLQAYMCGLQFNDFLAQQKKQQFEHYTCLRFSLIKSHPGLSFYIPATLYRLPDDYNLRLVIRTLDDEYYVEILGNTDSNQGILMQRGIEGIKPQKRLIEFYKFNSISRGKVLVQSSASYNIASSDAVNISSLTPNVDYFTWHVKQHFTGMLEKITNIDRKYLEKYFINIQVAFEKLDNEGMLLENEKLVRHSFLERLKERVLDSMALEIIKNIGGDSSAKKYDKNIRKRADDLILSQTDDIFWKTHIELTLNDISGAYFNQKSSEYFFENICKNTISVNNSFNRWNFMQENPCLIFLLKQHGLEKKLQDLKIQEEKITTETLDHSHLDIQNCEREFPGTYITLLYLIEGVCSYLKWHSCSIDQDEKKFKFEKIDEMVKKLSLHKGLELLKYLEIESGAREVIEKEIGIIVDNYRLQFYAEALANKAWENDIKRRFQNLKAWCDFIKNPNNAGCNYDGPNLEKSLNHYCVPTKHILGERLQYYFNDGGLTDPKNLIEICGGRKTSILAHHYAEYEFEILDQALGNINFDALGLDKDVAYYVFHSSFLDHEFDAYEVLETGFTVKTVKKLIQEIIDKPESEGEFELENIQQYVKKIKENFANISYLQNSKLQELKKRFNDAYSCHDLIEVQKLWPVFTKFQRLLMSTQAEKEKSVAYPKYRPSHEGPDYTFGKKNNKPNNYDDLLDKAWKAYESHSQENYFRIYPSQKTRFLKYESKNDVKVAKFYFIETMKELENLGRQIKIDLNTLMPIKDKKDKKDSSNLLMPIKDKKDSSNLFIPVLYFVVTDQPHKKGGAHKRIFVPISLQLFPDPILLSKDHSDKIFINEDEEGNNLSLKEHANKFYEQGIKLVGNEKLPSSVLDRKNSELYHSEHVFTKALENPINVQAIVDLLTSKMSDTLRAPLPAGEKYKIYSLALLAYSTNSVCDICTPSLIALQNTYEDGFLKHLIDKLNLPTSVFKTRGFENDRHKFRMYTLVTSDTPWSSQAFELKNREVHKELDIPNISKIMANPKGIIHLIDDSISLKKSQRSAEGVPEKYQRHFFELVGMDYIRIPQAVSSLEIHSSPQFIYDGNIFMSGSKSGKFTIENEKTKVKNTEAVNEVNVRLTEIMNDQKIRVAEANQVWKERKQK